MPQITSSPTSNMILAFLESSMLTDEISDDILQFKPAPTYSDIHSEDSLFSYSPHVQEKLKDVHYTLDVETKFHLFSTSFSINPNFFEEVFRNKFGIKDTWFRSRSAKMATWKKRWPNC